MLSIKDSSVKAFLHGASQAYIVNHHFSMAATKLEKLSLNPASLD